MSAARRNDMRLEQPDLNCCQTNKKIDAQRGPTRFELAEEGDGDKREHSLHYERLKGDGDPSFLTLFWSWQES